MARSTENGGGRHGRWRKAVWGAAAFLWVLIMVAIQVTEGLNLALTVAVSVIVLMPAGTYELVLALRTRSTAYRAAVGVALAAAFLLAWVNGAVGIIGSENQPANQMYGGVLLVGIIGAAMARFRPQRMATVLFATALVQLSVPVIALMIWQSQLSWGAAGMFGVFVMNAFFATLFVGSALLFRRAAHGGPEWGAA